VVDWRVPDERPPGFGVTSGELLDQACRRPGREVYAHPGPCELDAYGVEQARELEAGGVVGCVRCGRPVLVPPATCRGRLDVEEEVVEGVFEYGREGLRRLS
jgi:hypothetical protein